MAGLSSEDAELGTISRAAVEADADALLTCYGAGEQLGPAQLHAVVELCFTSSVRFLQPGLLLGGHSPPLQQQHHHGMSGQHQQHQQHQYGVSAQQKVSRSPGLMLPWLREAGRQQEAQPRRGWRQRKRQEQECMVQGLTEWQANPYYCGGRVTVPALVDIFACQAFFKQHLLLGVLSELAGDDGRAGGAALQQLPVPVHLAGKGYGQLVEYLLRDVGVVPLGLFRYKRENPAWRLQYVVCNPGADEAVVGSDRVFVLRPGGVS